MKNMDTIIAIQLTIILIMSIIINLKKWPSDSNFLVIKTLANGGLLLIILTLYCIQTNVQKCYSEISELKNKINNIDQVVTIPAYPLEESVIKKSYNISEEDINYIARVVMAEAEGECEEGQRLVIDTILNRMDSETSHWPDTVYGVLSQKNQYCFIGNPRYERCYVKPELVELVKEELTSRTNTEVVFFRTGRFSDYGTPYEKVGSHYFSSL